MKISLQYSMYIKIIPYNSSIWRPGPAMPDISITLTITQPASYPRRPVLKPTQIIHSNIPAVLHVSPDRPPVFTLLHDSVQEILHQIEIRLICMRKPALRHPSLAIAIARRPI